MAWLLLALAGLLEIGWAIGLKYTEGFTRLLPTVLTITIAFVSFLLLGLAVRHLPIGTAYAIWTAIGTAGTVLVGVILFGESLDLARLSCIALIVLGVIGLKLLSTH
ncbi:DMT family transporter [Modicisalibacter xianhensis]|uniref:Guanidinium exporter n=1 Tax=Modicisalibacter xianhensis TaxID=442341 RepID=A0A1I3CI81_9GAMM|nr:quaternary ammonium compound efflux SMR transporter SugE [Halomonas xianhensis]TDX28970.1 quaternary ammonium compound-resistance protein SugE [Halomonas xianhensis]SFH74227.1 quaternary ammonium compound-resistance protein SugE [Halomonas xianhensis]